MRGQRQAHVLERVRPGGGQPVDLVRCGREVLPGDPVASQGAHQGVVRRDDRGARERAVRHVRKRVIVALVEEQPVQVVRERRGLDHAAQPGQVARRACDVHRRPLVGVVEVGEGLAHVLAREQRRGDRGALAERQEHFGERARVMRTRVVLLDADQGVAVLGVRDGDRGVCGAVGVEGARERALRAAQVPRPGVLEQRTLGRLEGLRPRRETALGIVHRDGAKRTVGHRPDAGAALAQLALEHAPPGSGGVAATEEGTCRGGDGLSEARQRRQGHRGRLRGTRRGTCAASGGGARRPRARGYEDARGEGTERTRRARSARAG